MSNASVDPWACFHVYAEKSLLISEFGIIFDIFPFRLFLGSQWHACGTESLPIHYRVSQKKVGLANKLTNIAPEGWILFFGTPGRSALFPLTGPCSHKLGVGCVVFGPPIGKKKYLLFLWPFPNLFFFDQERAL